MVKPLIYPRIYLDAASLADMERYRVKVDGFTTNPSLMKKAGVTRYRDFAKTVLDIVGDKPVSFEVLADDDDTVKHQAREISSWGANVYVKIPILNLAGWQQGALIYDLSGEGIKLNITAIFTAEQVTIAAENLIGDDHIISVFAGRIFDTGTDPRAIVRYAVRKHANVLWASARQVFDVVLAEHAGAHIITLSPALIDKLPLRGKNLTEYSLDTVQQFHEDGKGIEF